MTEAESDAALLDFIRGKTLGFIHGGGLWTFPSDDPERNALHAACVRLEAAQQIRRIRDEPSPLGGRFVVWEAIKDPGDG